MGNIFGHAAPVNPRPTQKEELRIVLLGKAGGGKTSAMNTLLGSPGLTPSSASSETTECKMMRGECGGQKLVVIDTPGVFNTKIPKDKLKKEIVKCITYAAPGPHAFLYVLNPKSFTTEDERAVKIIQTIFGENSKNYTLALYTCADENEIPKGNIQSALMREFRGGYHSFDNKVNKPNQVPELLKKINNMVEKNEGKNYTNEMFKKAQESIKKKVVTPSNASQERLAQVADIILTNTVGEPLNDLVLGVVGSVAEKVGGCVSQ